MNPQSENFRNMLVGAEHDRVSEGGLIITLKPKKFPS